ncbi:TetR/AcrR family transcriptional regulator; helix-turn-helix transcriptional regulator [Actinoplanes bogorensis]|uniref:TetR/AcrR family transcriptional regulator helix-turn-helix transcriptional regulator n=1 Tax=Paractinoplanes bogorensis TaxID=1610840 RepID=A0ABS5YN53_9ACTN|nr:TetR/AcrR family transcriptional regulator [Actinoplanes bogorensis]MBU2664741.1 TetR/AcrR family transcriptional regulator; helix-turn-helix transcriptional regulator [Actinoplanes bogorensis]
MARPAHDRAEAIVAAARAEFLSAGVEQATVDAVAARAGVGKGTVFLYWPSKARLREAVLLLEVAGTFATLAAELRDDPARLRLGVIARREIAAIMDNPEMGPFLVQQFAGMTDPSDVPTRTLRRIIVALRRHGLVRRTGDDEVVMGMETVMAGALIRGFDRGGREPLLEAVDHLVSSAYDIPGDGAAALPEVLAALDDAIDELVAAAAPDRPTTARLRPAVRP